MKENIKVKVENGQDRKEVQELFFELGYVVVNNIDCDRGYVVALKNAKSPIDFDYWCNVEEELTIQQLRDLVVLKRNDVGDATHTSGNYQYYLTDSEFFEYRFGKWVNVDEYVDGIVFEPIEKKEMKEFLVKHNDKWTLQLLDSDTEENSFRKIVPDGADCLVGYNESQPNSQNWRTLHFGRIVNGRVNEIHEDYETTHRNTLEEIIERKQLLWQRKEASVDVPKQEVTDTSLEQSFDMYLLNTALLSLKSKGVDTSKVLLQLLNQEMNNGK